MKKGICFSLLFFILLFSVFPALDNQYGNDFPYSYYYPSEASLGLVINSTSNTQYGFSSKEPMLSGDSISNYDSINELSVKVPLSNEMLKNNGYTIATFYAWWNNLGASKLTVSRDDVFKDNKNGTTVNYNAKVDDTEIPSSGLILNDDNSSNGYKTIVLSVPDIFEFNPTLNYLTTIVLTLENE